MAKGKGKGKGKKGFGKPFMGAGSKDNDDAMIGGDGNGKVKNYGKGRK